MPNHNDHSDSLHSPSPDTQNPEENFLNFSEFSESILDDHDEEADNTPTIISKKPAPETNHGYSNSSSFNGGNIRGKLLAHFELIEPIGVGGMAAVLRARDTQLERNVALKILPPDMASEPENVRRFHQEARAAAKLDHENIARVYFCGEDQRLHFIAFEFVEGENLRTILERRGHLPVTEAIHYMLQVATGLAHASERNVVHRDIKPSNIIITPEGRAKLVDMGLARSREPRSSRDLTQSGVTLGTFDYISPEQALEPRDADTRSDIYSLGCTFYHVLTGQGPVPEGTAARKLHHHQHVAPVDPRQLNPDIPDSVAVILAKMMSKDPKDRYQRPEHLVQNLLQVARQLGSPAKIPEGMLYVDAPLLNPPRTRFGLLATLAMAGLLFVLGLLSLAPTPPGPEKESPRKPNPVVPQTHLPKPKFPEKKKAPEVPPIPVPQADKMVVAVNSEEDFDQALARPEKDLHIKILQDVSLKKEEYRFPGKGRSLTIEGISGEGSSQVTLSVAPQDSSPSSGGIVAEGGHVTFRNLHFHLKPGQQTTAASSIHLKSTSGATFEYCRFSQERSYLAPDWPSLSQRDLPNLMTSIRIENADDEAPESHKVFLDKCLFEQGQTALSLEGTGEIKPTNCAFFPHVALFQLRGDALEPEQNLELRNCSALVRSGPVFWVKDRSRCDIKVFHSIFSRPAGTTALGQIGMSPRLIHQSGNKSVVLYSGQRNAYHKVDFWVRLAEAVDNGEFEHIKNYTQFVKKLGTFGLADEHSHDLEDYPFRNETPLATGLPPRLAFQIDPKLPELRLKNDDLQQPIGLEYCVWGETYQIGELPPLPTVSLPKPEPVVQSPKEKIVDPQAPKDKTQKIPHYRTLAGAIGDAKPGDTISIKHNGPLPIKTVLLDGNLDITIRPYEGYRPVLTLQEKESSEPEVALFKMYRGKVQFENLAFHLQPEEKKYQSQSIVVLAGPGQCLFKKCLMTLHPAVMSQVGEETPLRVVTLAEVKKSLDNSSNDSPSIAKIFLQDSFVRGLGTFLTLDQSVPLELTVEDSLAALSGSLMEVNGDLEKIPFQGAQAEIKIERSTTYLTEHLIHLVDKRQGRGLLFTAVESSKCLFAAAADEPLIRLDGLNSKERIKEVFHWNGSQNAYCGYDKSVLTQQPADLEFPNQFNKVHWQMIANEADTGTRFVNDSLDFENLTDVGFARLLPKDFQAKIEQLQYDEPSENSDPLNKFGASLEALQNRMEPLDIRPFPILPSSLKDVPALIP